MKITLKDLKDKKACIAGQEWFIENFGKHRNIDIKNLENKLIKFKKGFFLCWLYENFNLSGQVKTYWNSYRIQRKYSYKDGVKDGEQVLFWYNGNIYLKYSYKNGKLNGEYIEYDKNGNIVEKSYYENGVKIK